MTANPMSKDISCQNFKGLIAYIRKHYGEGGIEKLTDGLIGCGYFVQDKYRPSEVVPVQESHLVDPAYWVSNEFSLKLLENVNHIVDGQHPLRTAQKAAAIVQDLLTLSRRGAMSMEALNLNRIIREYRQSPESEKMLSYHPRVVIETDLADDLFDVKGSPVHVSKTIMNLVSNAVEAMPEGGTVRVKTENCYVDTQLQAYEEIREGEYCLLTVTDTGVGISEEDRDKIFEPFFTKKKMGRSGTGLGMAVVWGTVKDHGGYINVESKIGQGTCINIYFPATRIQAKAAKASIDLSELKGQGEKILVIDDVAEQHQIAVDMLNSLGYAAEAVQSGEEAVDYLQARACDLLILDMIMDPGMDGLATFREILQFRPQQKAVIASGYSETDRVKEAQRIGAGAYIRKPYTLEKIGLTVKSALDGQGPDRDLQ